VSRAYLAICAIYRDEAPYLREWVAFHQLVGVERFFLYDNFSVDDHRAALAPFVDDGTVVIHDWPVHEGQYPAYDDCLARHRDDARWIAFIDLDEFLFSPAGTPVPAVLRDFEDHPGVVVNWAMYGTSGHLTKPEGLVIETHLHRKRYGEGVREHVKSIVDPARTDHVRSAHVFAYEDGAFPVNEQGRPQDHPPFSFADFSIERLCVNHYSMKSDEEFARKVARGGADGKQKVFPPNTYEKRKAGMNAEYDDTITVYLPRLKERLAELEERRPSAREHTAEGR
jgi:Glycosyltransferase family 92